MHFLLSLAVAVMGNVISYYIVKWLDSNRKNGNQPGTTSTWKLQNRMPLGMALQGAFLRFECKLSLVCTSSLL